jgi:hypothetical protein
MVCEEIRYIVNLDIIPLYIDSAKTFMSLATGALGLTITFREKIVGMKAGTNVSTPMIISWLFFLLTIASSSFYQYLGVKFLDSVSCFPGTIQYFETLVKNPGKVYGVMLISFVLGALFLVVSACLQLPKNEANKQIN